ncbi:MAG: hypothetical protein LKF32_03275 [Mageeibacillus sp.]|nr:hypothetical protein [Mageeibacillus sp.]MCI1264452.1 hypothetical protein [Saccharofermentans sp.]MCI1768819.1 hypothetical protein [Mageeibacillus sp.]
MQNRRSESKIAFACAMDDHDYAKSRLRYRRLPSSCNELLRRQTGNSGGAEAGAKNSCDCLISSQTAAVVR